MKQGVPLRDVSAKRNGGPTPSSSAGHVMSSARRGGQRRWAQTTLRSVRKAKTIKAKRSRPVRRGQYEYTVVFEPAEEGGSVVTVPALPGLHTEGDTFEEAQAMAADAIRCYIEGCILDGEEIPVEHGYAITQRIPVQVSSVKA